MSLSASHYKNLVERKKKEVELFERKFLDYRNKMKELYYEAEEGSPLRETIRSFLEDEQGDVHFNK